MMTYPTSTYTQDGRFIYPALGGVMTSAVLPLASGLYLDFVRQRYYSTV